MLPAPLWADLPDLPSPRKPVAEQSFLVPPWPRNTARAPWGLAGRGGGADIRVFRFSPDGKFLVGMTNGAWEMEVREVDSGKSLGTFGALEHHAGAMCLSRQGTRLIVAHSTGGPIELWDWQRQRLIRNLDEWVLADSESISQVAFLDERRFLLAENDGSIWVWDVETADELDRWTPLPRPEQRSSRHFRALAVSPDGSTLAVVEESQLYLVDTTTGKLRRTLAHLPMNSPIGQTRYSIRCMEFSRDGRILAVGTHDAVRLYDLKTSEELPPLTAHSGGLRALHFTPDGKLLLSLGRDDRLLTWSVAEINRPWSYPGKSSNEELERTCNEMDFHDPWQSYVSLQVLRSAPDEALIHLRKRLRPVAVMTAGELEALAARLESDDPNVRRAALREVGDSRQMVARRLEELTRERIRRARGADGAPLTHLETMMNLRRGSKSKPTAAAFHEAELIHLLPRIGTGDAKALAQAIAKGAADDYRTEAAKEALELWPQP